MLAGYSSIVVLEICLPPPNLTILATCLVTVTAAQDDRKFSESREDEGMGTGDIKYGDTFVFLQHMKSGLWLSYQTFETKKRGVGRVEEKKVTSFVLFRLPATGSRSSGILCRLSVIHDSLAS